MDLFREKHIPQTECGPSQKAREPRNMVWLVFMDWVISQANEWEDYSNYFREGVEISRNWATAHFLAFYGWPQNFHGTGGCVI